MSKGKNESKTAGILFALIGAFILITIYNGNFDINREANPGYDSQQDEFSLDLLAHSTRAEEGDLYQIDLEVTNEGSDAGKMFVQCSILDRDASNMDWIPETQSITKLATEDNCVADEPFTQTLMIELEGLETDIAKFVITVPKTSGGDNIIWCEAFEQCYSVEENSMQSDYLIKEIEIFKKDEVQDNNNINDEGEDCIGDDDCASWFTNSQECVNGYCIDKADAEELNFDFPDLSDDSIKEYVSGHKVAFIIAGIILFLVGMMIVYSEPKVPRYLR